MVGGARIENIAEGQLSWSWTMAKNFEIDGVECINFFPFSSEYRQGLITFNQFNYPDSKKTSTFIVQTSAETD